MSPVPLRILSVAWPVALASAAWPQVGVRVLDAGSGEGVPYAHLAWQPLAGGPGNMVVSGPDGRATLPLDAAALAGGVALRISFVGYEPLLDTLLSEGARTYRLKGTVHGLPEVVVTGQYAPNTPERAVHKVRVIDARQFQRMAANNLGDALRNELNIQLRQDNILGTSLTMQGLGGENVKVLVDGIPVIGRQDGNIDLAQMDLTGIERAEIVEGPLSVNYGSNALAGTINLITRKAGGATASLKATAYAEHIGRLNTTLTATRRWGRHNTVLTAGRNFFNGWDPAQQGIPSFAPAPADTNRFQQWKPREQYIARLNHRWTGRQWSLGYKGEGMHDVIVNRGRPRPPYHETAFDERYATLRLDNAVFAERRFGRGRNLNAFAAHNRYARQRNTWFRDLTTLGEQLTGGDGAQDTSRFALSSLRAVYANAGDSARIGYELGIDLNHETGSGQRMDADLRDIGDHAVFATMEYRPSARITLKPGARWAHNTRYAAPLTPSLNLRWKVTERLVARASYARGFRAPSLKELHLLFVDVNHDITGNPALDAERSHNLSAGLTYRHAREKRVYRGEIGLFHNTITDLITLAQVSGTRYSYANIGMVRTAGGTAGAAWDNGHWIVSAGGGVTGRYDALAEEHGEPWLLNTEVRASLTRNWMRKGWTVSLFWKRQGELANYMVVSDTVLQRGFIAPFSMADATLGKRLWGDRLLVSAGCKDLFNVRNVNANVSGGAHSGGGNSVPMTTGRTFFLRVEMDLKKKDR